jgi:hypothetical protein
VAALELLRQSARSTKPAPPLSHALEGTALWGRRPASSLSALPPSLALRGMARGRDGHTGTG